MLEIGWAMDGLWLNMHMVYCIPKSEWALSSYVTNSELDSRMRPYILIASAVKWSSSEHSETGLKGIGVGNTELRRHESTSGESRYGYRSGVGIVGTECC